MSETLRTTHNELIDMAISRNDADRCQEAMILRLMLLKGFITASQYMDTATQFLAE